MRQAERPRTEISGSDGSTATSPDRWEPWKNAGLVVLITHLAFLALAWAGSYYLSGSDGIPEEGFVDIWRRWDTEHYTDIAEHGYSSSETHEFAEAFFPLYPLAIRVISFLGIGPVIAGMLISSAAAVVALAYLYRLAEEDLFPGAGQRATLLLALFPTAVFMTAAYSESLFLAGAIPAFYYARRARWAHVALPAAVAMGARFAGLFVVMGLAVEFLRQREFARRRVLQAAFGLGIALLPLLGYMVYLWAANDDPFYFVEAQAQGWQREMSNANPFIAAKDALVTTWNTFEGDYPSTFLLAWRVEIAAAIVGVFFTTWAFKRREYGYGVYMAATMLPLLLSRWYTSIPRMLLSMFPIVLILVSVTRKEERFAYTLATSAAFAALGVLVFTRGQWFF